MFVLLSVGAAARPLDCAGGIDLRPLTGKQLIVFGELHGTLESPAFVGRVLCSLLQEGHRVQLGLELWAGSEDVPLRRYIRSTGAQQDRAALLSSPSWSREPRLDDGNASIGLFDLVELVRKLRMDGAAIEIFAFNNSIPYTGTDQREAAALHEQRMAANVEHAMLAHPDATTLLLVGGGHALRRPLREPGYPPMLTYLQRFDPRTLRLAHHGGAAWLLTSDGSGPRLQRPGHCDPPDRAAEPIELGIDPYGDYDGCYSVGTITAAPPARDLRR